MAYATPTTPTSDFIDNGNGTVTHKKTGLIWQRCAVGQTWTGSDCSLAVAGYTYNKALALTSNFASHSDWRLPTIAELQTIIGTEAINNRSIFSDTYGAWYWSSSLLNDDNTNRPLGFSFHDGGVYGFHRGDLLGVRLVRGQWSASNNAAKVVLLLHGMNSSFTTWNDVVSKYFSNCPKINNGKIYGSAKANTENSYCYRINFGAFDASSPDKGLEDAWTFGKNNGYVSAGDYSTFEQLGVEIDNAISTIRKAQPSAKILLIGHSRGGLAARAFLQRSGLSLNKGSVVGLITTGTPHNGTRMGRIYKYIDKVLLHTDRTRSTDSDSVADWQAIDFLTGKIDCNSAFRNQGFNIDARRPVIGYLADNGSMIKNLNDNKTNLPLIPYGELVYDGTYLGKLSEKEKAGVNWIYNLFDEPSNDICHQVSKRAEAFIKGGTFNKPTSSTTYLGDGIVTADSQGSTDLPSAEKNTYNLGVLHTKEPEQVAHIADMTCKLGLPWLSSCNGTVSAKSKNQTTPFKPVEIISHDYDALVSQETEKLWQDWLAVITDDAQSNQRAELEVALGLKLRSSDNAALIAEMKQRLSDNNASDLELARVAMLLAEIATPSALEILTDALDLTSAQNAIIAVADSLPENPRRDDLSLVLESAWTRNCIVPTLQRGNAACDALASRNAGALPNEFPRQSMGTMGDAASMGTIESTLANAIAKLGTARGVDVLLSAIDKTGEKLPFSSRKPKNQAERLASAAFSAMDSIINTDSETVLSNAFSSHRANEAVFIAAGNSLVNLGSETAAQLVMQRLDELPDSAQAIAQQWLNSLSGKVEKVTLRRIAEKAKPRKRVLQKQLEALVR